MQAKGEDDAMPGGYDQFYLIAPLSPDGKGDPQIILLDEDPEIGDLLVEDYGVAPSLPPEGFEVVAGPFDLPHTVEEEYEVGKWVMENEPEEVVDHLNTDNDGNIIW